MTNRSKTSDRLDDQRAAGYIRVSTVEQSMPDKPSLEQQRARIEATCRAQDLDLTHQRRITALLLASG